MEETGLELPTGNQCCGSQTAGPSRRWMSVFLSWLGSDDATATRCCLAVCHVMATPAIHKPWDCLDRLQISGRTNWRMVGLVSNRNQFTPKHSFFSSHPPFCLGYSGLNILKRVLHVQEANCSCFQFFYEVWKNTTDQ